MRNRCHAAMKALMSPELPSGFAGFRKPHLGRCSSRAHRLVMVLPFANGTGGAVHLCDSKRKEPGIEDNRCGTARRCRVFVKAPVSVR